MTISPDVAESKLSEGRSKEYWQLVGLERDLGEQLALLDVRDQAVHQLRRAADGSVFRRLATSVLEPARLERAVPLSRFAGAALPDPDRLHGRDWVAEIYSCPADVVTLTGGLEANLRMLQVAGDELQLLAALLGERSARATRYFKSVYQPALAAVDSQTTAEGKEFVPTGLSGRWLERLGAAAVLLNLFEVLPLASASVKLPAFQVRPGRPYRHPEQTADAGQVAIGFVTPGTAAVSLTASKIAVTAIVSGEATEDMLVPLLGAIEAELGDWLAAGADDALVNGDTTATHMDTDVTAASDVRKSWNGLRKLAPAAGKTDGANVALTAAMLRANRKKLGRAGSIAGQLVHIVGPTAVEQLAGDTAVTNPER